MSPVDDSSGTSSFEDIGDISQRIKDARSDKENATISPDIMAGLGGNLGTVVAGQVSAF